MAFVKSADIIVKKMDDLESSLYAVQDQSGKLLSENDDETMPICDAQKDLIEMLDSLEGIVTVVLRVNPKTKVGKGGSVRGNHYYSIKLATESAKTENINGVANQPVMNNSIYGLMEKNFNTQIEMMKNENAFNKQIEDLKKAIKEDKENSGLQIVKEIVNELKPFLPMIMQQLNTAPIMPGIAGNVKDKIKEDEIISPEDIQRIQIAIAKLLKTDSNFVKNIEMLAEFSERFPADYVSIIPMLEFKLNTPK